MVLDIFMMTPRSKNQNQSIYTSPDSFPIQKNFYVLCFAIFLFSNAIQAVNSLQSSVNFVGGLGVVTTSIYYGVSVMANLLWTTIILRGLGLKYAIILGMATQSTYFISNLYPAWYTMAPTALLSGMFTAGLFPAKNAYISHLGSLADKNVGTSEKTVRFFGIYSVFFFFSMVFGTLFSHFVLDAPEVTVGSSEFCGSRFCDSLISQNDTNFAPISNIKRALLFGGLSGIAVLAIIIVFFFLDQVRFGPPLELVQYARLSLSTLCHFASKNHLLLSLSNFYRGLSISFIIADFTKAFITCSFSVDDVGFVVMSYGVACGVSSFLLSRLVKHTGRLPVFICSASLHASLIFSMLTWMSDPRDHTIYAYFIIAALWGVGHSVFEYQMSALYSYLFPDSTEQAFTVLQSLDDLGKTLSFALSSVICFSTKLYIMSALLALATVGYIIVEVPLFLHDQKLRREGKNTNEFASN